ncbi:MAG: J domain-containing protein [Euryarchaeota archaeon]|nr:J domain-containing protein [Euryarchaeota archaeon]
MLDVSTDASRDEIKKAYRRLFMLCHPERPPTWMPRRR